MAGRELAFPEEPVPEDLPRVVLVDPAVVDVPEPVAADAATAAVGLEAEVAVAREWVEAVVVEVRLVEAVVGAEGRPEVADADATVVG